MTADDSAIVVGRLDYGDHDRIVRFLSASRGRFAVLARGARRGTHSWAPLLEAGVAVRLDLKRGRGPLPLLRDASLIDRPRRAREDLDRLAALTYGVELCAALAPEDHEAPRLHRLLRSWLATVEGDHEPGAAARQALEAKALTFAGLTPALVICPVCGVRLDDPCAFNNEAGGGVHARCAPGRAVHAADLMRLEGLRRTPLADTAGVRPALPLYLLADFVEWHLGAGIKARPMLEELEASRDQP